MIPIGNWSHVDTVIKQAYRIFALIGWRAGRGHYNYVKYELSHMQSTVYTTLRRACNKDVVEVEVRTGREADHAVIVYCGVTKYEGSFIWSVKRYKRPRQNEYEGPIALGRE